MKKDAEMTRVSKMTADAARPQGRWHVPAAVLAAYAAEDVSEADAWSTESHLARCGRCRADLAASVDGGPAGNSVTAARHSVLAYVGRPEQLTTAATPRRERAANMARWTRPALVLRGPWMTAVVVAVLVASVAEFFTSRAAGGLGQAPMIFLLSPLVPLAGVGLCYRATDRGWAEAVLATPSAGLKLVLWRVLAVLMIAIPMTVVVAAFDHHAAPVAWLLPTFGLVAASLALGSRLELGRATAAVASVWAVAVAAPPILTGRVPIDVFSDVAQGVWAAVLLGSLAVVVARRAEFGRLPTWRPATMGQQQ